MLEALGLDTIPFAPDPKPGSIFQSSQLQEVERRILFAVEAKGITVLMGSPGEGKTTALRQAKDKLAAKKKRVIYTTESTGGAFGVLRSLHYGMGLKPPHFKADLSQRFVEACTASDEPIVVIVDEAHLMNDAGLQQLRILTNQDFDTRPPFVLILAGCTELREVLAQPQLSSLRKRVLMSYQLEGLTEDETKLYLEHHLQRAGARRKLFDTPAIRELFGYSRGNPRTINQLALTALIAAVADGKQSVGLEQLRRAIQEMDARP